MGSRNSVILREGLCTTESYEFASAYEDENKSNSTSLIFWYRKALVLKSNSSLTIPARYTNIHSPVEISNFEKGVAIHPTRNYHRKN